MEGKVILVNPDDKFSFLVAADGGSPPLSNEKLRYLYDMDVATPPANEDPQRVTLGELGSYKMGVSRELVDSIVKVKHYKTGKKPILTKPLSNALNNMEKYGIDRINYTTTTRTRSFYDTFTRSFITDDFVTLKILMDAYPYELIEKIKLPIPSDIMERYGIIGNVKVAKKRSNQIHHVSISFPYDKRRVMPSENSFSFPVRKAGSTLYLFENPPTKEQMEEVIYVCSVYSDHEITLYAWDELMESVIEYYEKII